MGERHPTADVGEPGAAVAGRSNGGGLSAFCWTWIISKSRGETGASDEELLSAADVIPGGGRPVEAERR